MNATERFNPLNENIKSQYNRASELARVTWDAIQDLPDGDLAFILGALSKRCLCSRPERVVVALDALRRCEEAIGRVPSATKYGAFRKQHPELDLRSVKFISNTFGSSWKNAISAYLGEPITDVLRKRLTSSVSSYTDEELVAFVREFIEIHHVEWIDGRAEIVCGDPVLEEERRTIGCLTQNGFRTYARQQENLYSRRFPSLELIKGRFGGWKSVVAAAALGISDSELRVAAIETTETCHTPVTHFTTEEILDWVSISRGEIDGPLNDCSFTEWREGRLGADPSTPIPSARTVRARFDSFDKLADEFPEAIAA